MCHYSADDDEHVLVEVSQQAAGKHLDPQHGHANDVRPGHDGRNCVCEPLTPDNICVGAVLGTPCSDDNACTLDDACDGDGACQPGVQIVCDTAQGRADGTLTDCLQFTGTCLPESGCIVENVPDGASCDDADPSTCADHCHAGTCASLACDGATCVDGIECASDQIGDPTHQR